MAIPFLDLQRQYKTLRPTVDDAMQQVLDTSAYILGPAVEKFEKDFAAYCEVEHCIGLNSGTAALALLLQAHGIGPGDEVITQANSFYASAEAISEVGATPVLVDCVETTAMIDVSQIEAAITPNTKAIIPVHLYGQCAPMDDIMTIAKAHHLIVIEDACQAHGARYKGKRAGSIGHSAAFSFYPGKNLGAYGDAGAITTNDASIAETVHMLREHGSKKKYHHDLIGWNERMDGLQGAVLQTKLSHLDTWNMRRREIAALYRKNLPSTVRVMNELPESEPVYHLFVIRTEHRDALQTYLLEKGIHTMIHYPIPIHLQAAYKDHNWKQGDFPVAEKLSKEVLSLPMFAELTDDECLEVTKAMKEFNH